MIEIKRPVKQATKQRTNKNWKKYIDTSLWGTGNKLFSVNIRRNIYKKSKSAISNPSIQTFTDLINGEKK